MSDVSALILAGGKATRFGGIAKHQLVVRVPADRSGTMIAGRTIFEHQTSLLAPRAAEILVSAPTDIAGFRCVRDAAGEGPLAGIAAGLAACATPWLLVLAGDMPFVTPAILDSLIAARAPELDAVGLEINGLPEPLCCLLHTRTRAIVERRLAAQRYKASGLLTDEGLNVRWLTDADPRALRNLNSPSDMPD